LEHRVAEAQVRAVPVEKPIRVLIKLRIVDSSVAASGDDATINLVIAIPENYTIKQLLSKVEHDYGL
jgi:hypothetical protein